jgi:hypothetical protein
MAGRAAVDVGAAPSLRARQNTKQRVRRVKAKPKSQRLLATLRKPTIRGIGLPTEEPFNRSVVGAAVAGRHARPHRSCPVQTAVVKVTKARLPPPPRGPSFRRMRGRMLLHRVSIPTPAAAAGVTGLCAN